MAFGSVPGRFAPYFHTLTPGQPAASFVHGTVYAYSSPKRAAFVEAIVFAPYQGP